MISIEIVQLERKKGVIKNAYASLKCDVAIFKDTP